MKTQINRTIIKLALDNISDSIIKHLGDGYEVPAWENELYRHADAAGIHRDDVELYLIGGDI